MFLVNRWRFGDLCLFSMKTPTPVGLLLLFLAFRETGGRDSPLKGLASLGNTSVCQVCKIQWNRSWKIAHTRQEKKILYSLKKYHYNCDRFSVEPSSCSVWFSKVRSSFVRVAFQDGASLCCMAWKSNWLWGRKYCVKHILKLVINN